MLATRKLLYRGQHFFCPCCDTSYRRFLDMTDGASDRKNVICPGCGVAERHRLLLLYLERETKLFKTGGKVLYFAPEFSLQKKMQLDPKIEYLSADISSALAMVKFDIHDIPYESDSFDYIFCSHVLSHVKDDKQALQEMKRVLRPSGSLFIFEGIHENTSTIENKSVKTAQQRLQTYGQADRWRKYGKDFVTRLKMQGFSVEAIPYARTFSQEEQEKMRLSETDILYVLKKTSSEQS